ncbi:hypothetical protein KY321_02815 [Candidatus Woesearchaeota archaeon]|nr:hypothetical protein [Candidatus Woesearchaeota archaeon]
MKNNNVILLLSNNLGKLTVNRYNQLVKNRPVNSDIYIILDSTREMGTSTNLPLFRFTFSELKELNICLFQDQSLVPGNTHLPIFLFFSKNRFYKKYWLIEDDVCFTGNWRDFFSDILTNQFDFGTCHIRKYDQEPNWNYWKIKKDGKALRKKDMIRSFNTIYCFSNIGIQQIINSLQNNKWHGHHEVLLPTICKILNLKLFDFGGDGSYTPEKLKNKYYISESKIDGSLGNSSFGTMRYRPRITFTFKRNTLYHPVKELSLIIRILKFFKAKIYLFITRKIL